MKPKPDRPTISELALRYRVSPSTIGRWKARGYDVFTDAALRASVAAQHRAPGSFGNAPPTAPGEAPRPQTSKERREILQCDLLAAKIAREKGTVEAKEVVAEAFSRIGAAVSARVAPVGAELAAVLEGKSAPQIKITLDGWSRRVLDELAALDPYPAAKTGTKPADQQPPLVVALRATHKPKCSYTA